MRLPESEGLGVPSLDLLAGLLIHEEVAYSTSQDQEHEPSLWTFIQFTLRMKESRDSSLEAFGLGVGDFEKIREKSAV